MNLDWGRPFGADPGEHQGIGKWLTFLWLILGLVSLLTGLVMQPNWTPLVVLGGSFILLGLIGVGMAAGVIPRPGRK